MVVSGRRAGGVVRAERPPLSLERGARCCALGHDVGPNSPMPGAASTSDRARATRAHRPRPDRCLSKSAGRGLGPERTWSQGGQTIRARSCGPGDRGSGPRFLADAPRWHGARDVGRPLRCIVVGVAHRGRKCTRENSVNARGERWPAMPVIDRRLGREIAGEPRRRPSTRTMPAGRHRQRAVRRRSGPIRRSAQADPRRQ